MQTSTTILTKPLHLWLARIIALAVILTSIGIGVGSIPEVLNTLKHQGFARDVYWELDQNGEAVVTYVSPLAEGQGVAIGDKVLNYQDDKIDKLGTPVTLQIQRGSSPARELTFLRNDPANDAVFSTMQVGLSFDASVTLSFIFISIIPLLVCGVGSLLLFWLRSNDWMALLTATVLSNLAMPSFINLTNPFIHIFEPLMFLTIFFWLTVFPNGKLLPRWSWILILALVPNTISSIVAGVDPQTWMERFAPFNSILAALSWIGALAILGIQHYRYRYIFSAVERQQSKWVLTALVIGLVPLILTSVVFSTYYDAHQYEQGDIAFFFNFCAGIVLTVMLAVGIFFAIFRYRLWDIDIIINRALVYGTLTAIVVGIYVLIVGGLGTAIQGRNNLMISVLATGLVAVLVQPLRDRLQRGVNRMMYGERDDPVTVLSRLGQRLEATIAPDAVLPALVETVAQTLKLPYAAITRGTANDSEIAAAYGQASDELVRLPLSYQGETISQLVVAPRARGEEFNPADYHLLKNIAHQAGMAVHAVSLTADLQRSRERLVTTREEERRRLRRDLHDGLGPNLASQGLKLAAVKQLLENDPASATPLLDQVMAQNHSTVEEVRRLVYGLRPPSLDELGLVAAIRDHIAGIDRNSTLQIDVTESAEALPPLSAAVEVAAYRIVLEALTNVIRHAQARHCTIQFSRHQSGSGDQLQIEIVDNGIGLPKEMRAGVGLRSMRERAEEVGGKLTFESQPSITRVLAILPFGEPSTQNNLSAPSE